MKIKDIILEAGFWKGVSQSLAPTTTSIRDRQTGGILGDYSFEYGGNQYKLTKNGWAVQNKENGRWEPASQVMQNKLNKMSGRESDSAKQSSGQSQQRPYTSPLGITVIKADADSIILGYKNRNFALNNRGEWSLDGKDTAGATASGAIQAEMDKVAQSTGYM